MTNHSPPRISSVPTAVGSSSGIGHWFVFLQIFAAPALCSLSFSAAQQSFGAAALRCLLLITLAMHFTGTAAPAAKPKVWIYSDMSDKTIPGPNAEGTVNRRHVALVHAVEERQFPLRLLGQGFQHPATIGVERPLLLHIGIVANPIHGIVPPPSMKCIRPMSNRAG